MFIIIHEARFIKKEDRHHCRTWFARVEAAAPDLIRQLFPADLQSAAAELASYLVDSFGNATRIDYGTGHETTFCALLCCLAKLGVFTERDTQAGASQHVASLSFIAR
jgi:serine/threonine-protein phosphatase 2A activator